MMNKPYKNIERLYYIFFCFYFIFALLSYCTFASILTIYHCMMVFAFFLQLCDYINTFVNRHSLHFCRSSLSVLTPCLSFQSGHTATLAKQKYFYLQCNTSPHTHLEPRPSDFPLQVHNGPELSNSSLRILKWQ